MKIVKTREITPKDVLEITEPDLLDFKDRAKLHEDSIPTFFVYIQDYAWNAFISHGNNVYKELRHEAQGIFVGQYFKDKFGEFVVATSYAEGNGNSQSSYVEMSEECLAKISEKCQTDGTLMLIWVHTHPGLGVFYSGTDYNCLKTNFYMPYQIGLVVDILKKQIKGFKTNGGEVLEFDNYALFNDEQNRLFPPYQKVKIINEKDRIIKELREENKELREENKELREKIKELEEENQLLKKKREENQSGLSSTKKSDGCLLRKLKKKKKKKHKTQK
jgi:proteasome lid subunit RPN8/RPN11/FtsZ-binding cell division protein ZapB